MFLVLETLGRSIEKIGNTVLATKMCLNLLGNISCCWEENFVSAILFPEAGKSQLKLRLIFGSLAISTSL